MRWGHVATVFLQLLLDIEIQMKFTEEFCRGICAPDVSVCMLGQNSVMAISARFSPGSHREDVSKARLNNWISVLVKSQWISCLLP